MENFYLKLKHLKHILLVLTLYGFSALRLISYGQNPVPGADTLKKPVSPSIVSDSLAIASDSTKGKTTDSLQADKGDIETTIFYQADDSIRMDVVKRIVYLYGNAQIHYGKISLSAGEMEINWETNIVTARPALDTAGHIHQTPIFKDGPDVYQIDTIRYNFKSRKGLISGVVFKQNDGYIHGSKVKKVQEDLYINHAKYTTCNLADPHFYISASKLKVIPDDKVVSGPFNLVISRVHTPFGFFLGFFPFPKKQKSGFIIPSVGSSARGFYLQQGGYYWAVNDYLGVRFLGDVYANSSFRGNVTGNYIKRYKYAGTFNLSYSQTKSGFGTSPPVPDFNVQWSHRTLTRKNSNFSANVNLGSSNFFKRTSYNPMATQMGQLNSQVQYYKAFGSSPFNINLALRHDQNLTTRVMNLTLPELNLAMNPIFPFKKAGESSKAFYKNIRISYQGNVRVFLTNDSVRIKSDSTFPFAPKNLPFLLSKGQYGARHTIPVITTIKFNKTFLKYFNFSPYTNYTAYWYNYSLYNFRYDAERKTVISDTVKGFNSTYSYNGGISLTTTIYGMYKFKNMRLKAIRHTIVPNISYTYVPGFKDAWEQHVATDTSKKFFQDYSRYQGTIWGGPPLHLTSGLTFSINNSLEAKALFKKDTTGTMQKFMILEQFAVGGSYNFAADSNKLSQLVFTARTRILKGRIDLNSGATFDPYDYNFYSGHMTRTGKYSIAQGALTQYNFSIGGPLNRKAAPKQYKSDKGAPQDLRFINTHPEQFVDFNIPWNLNVRYNLGYTHVPGNKPYTSQSLQLTGDVRLTQKWMISFITGYDLQLKRITSSSLSINRDLHCWQMALNVVPFGQYRSYSFTLSAKSSILQDLKLTKRNASYFGSYY